MAHKLNFKPGTQRNRKLKANPDKYKLSEGRPNISMSDGIAPAFPLVPHKRLNTSFQDINTQDYVVIPKGRIVSCLLPFIDADLNTGAIGADGTAITINSDDSYYGVSKAIKGLIVPANGGGAVSYKYNAADATTVPGATSGMVVEGEWLQVPANAPIGCMEHDVYQDVRGANLNYDMRNKNWGVLSSQLIKIPAVNIALLDEFLSSVDGFAADGSAPVAADIQSNSSNYNASGTYGGYKAASTKYAFFSYANDDGNDSNEGYGGQLLQSDALGNWVAQKGIDFGSAYTAGAYTAGTSGTAETGSYVAGSFTSSVAVRNEQTAGRLLGVDFRYEKDMLDVVQGPYDQKVAGSQTLGLPDFLYNFAKDSIVGSGGDLAGTLGGESYVGQDEAYAIKAAVDAGCFGYAWIQLNIR